MEKMMQQLTMDKSTQYTQKSVTKLYNHKQQLVRTHCTFIIALVVVNVLHCL